MPEHTRRGEPTATARTDGGRDEFTEDDETFEFPDERRDLAGGGSPDGDDEADSAPLGDIARRLDGESRAHGERDGTRDAFDELDEELDEELGSETAVTDDVDELFEEMDVSDVDTEEVWENVLDDTDAEPADADLQQGRAGSDDARDGPNSELGEGTGAAGDDEAEETVVPKNSYCESCYFFSSPPEVACTYSGAAVVEIVDSEQFRVRNCPVVAGLVNTDGTNVAGQDDGDGLTAGPDADSASSSSD